MTNDPENNRLECLEERRQVLNDQIARIEQQIQDMEENLDQIAEQMIEQPIEQDSTESREAA